MTFEEILNQAMALLQCQGRVVAVVGEAGVGKARLVYECIHAQGTQGWRVLESISVSYGKATPYFPVIDLHILTQREPDRVLYLAVHEEVFFGVFEEAIGRLLLENHRVKLLVFDRREEVILRWIP